MNFIEVFEGSDQFYLADPTELTLKKMVEVDGELKKNLVCLLVRPLKVI